MRPVDPKQRVSSRAELERREPEDGRFDEVMDDLEDRHARRRRRSQREADARVSREGANSKPEGAETPEPEQSDGEPGEAEAQGGDERRVGSQSNSAAESGGSGASRRERSAPEPGRREESRGGTRERARGLAPAGFPALTKPPNEPELTPGKRPVHREGPEQPATLSPEEVTAEGVVQGEITVSSEEPGALVPQEAARDGADQLEPRGELAEELALSGPKESSAEPMAGAVGGLQPAAIAMSHVPEAKAAAGSNLDPQLLQQVAAKVLEGVHVHMTAHRPRVDLALDLGKLGAAKAVILRQGAGDASAFSISFTADESMAELALRKGLPELASQLTAKGLNLQGLRVEGVHEAELVDAQHHPDEEGEGQGRDRRDPDVEMDEVGS